jgi:fructosamine-3-kinase
MDFNDLHFDQIQFLESILFEGLGREVSVEDYQFLSGGDVNTSLRIDTGEGYYFVKWNESAGEELFACESMGLQLLREAGVIRVPGVISYGRKAEKAYLLLEFVGSARPQPAYWERFGEQLAALHAHTGSAFGLPYDNYIGSLAQRNTPTDNGVRFFTESRLQAQAGLAFYNGQLPKALYDKFPALYERLPELLPAERPALVHGDLWSGNVLVDERGAACLIDPAAHYGLREAEIAFTKLFGGFEDAFYGAYESAFPLAPGFAQRVELYNLYPLLVHLNLFGSGYLPGIERVLRKF